MKAEFIMLNKYFYYLKPYNSHVLKMLLMKPKIENDGYNFNMYLCKISVYENLV